jgi:hypothetical protein
LDVSEIAGTLLGQKQRRFERLTLHRCAALLIAGNGEVVQ